MYPILNSAGAAAAAFRDSSGSSDQSDSGPDRIGGDSLHADSETNRVVNPLVSDYGGGMRIRSD
jgi:hypothetical protein